MSATPAPILVRAFTTDLQMTGPRTLTAQFVPWNLPTEVADRSETGKLDIYVEGFRRGAFDGQATSSEPAVLRRVGFKHAHVGGLGFLGHLTALRNTDDGLEGDVSILRSKADDVADLLDSGIDGVSMEFQVLRGGEQREDGVRWRTRAHLHAVALEAQQAYAGARVLAFREEIDEQLATEAEAQAAEEAKLERDRKMAELDAFMEAERAKQADLLASLTR
jgi:HK97 family phage prohead protease